MSADFDPFQAAIIGIALLAGFVKWLWENWRQKRGAAQSTPQMDEQERQLREAAWRKQTGQDSPPPIPSVPPPVAPSPWDELRKAWKELQETAREGLAPARPVKPVRPPLVPQQRQQSVRAASVSAISPPPVVVAAAPAPAATETYYPQQQKTTTVSVLAALQNLRRDPALMRQAILMQEILGPPKALQTSGDLAI